MTSVKKILIVMRFWQNVNKTSKMQLELLTDDIICMLLNFKLRLLNENL